MEAVQGAGGEAEGLGAGDRLHIACVYGTVVAYVTCSGALVNVILPKHLLDMSCAAHPQAPCGSLRSPPTGSRRAART